MAWADNGLVMGQCNARWHDVRRPEAALIWRHDVLRMPTLRAVWTPFSLPPAGLCLAPLPQVFANLPTEVGATEAEEIGVEHLLRDVKDAAVSTLASEVRRSGWVSRAAGVAATGRLLGACCSWRTTMSSHPSPNIRSCLVSWRPAPGSSLIASPPRYARSPGQVGDMVTGLRGLRSRLLEIREYLEAVRRQGGGGGVSAGYGGC